MPRSIHQAAVTLFVVSDQYKLLYLPHSDPIVTRFHCIRPSAVKRSNPDSRNRLLELSSTLHPHSPINQALDRCTPMQVSWFLSSRLNPQWVGGLNPLWLLPISLLWLPPSRLTPGLLHALFPTDNCVRLIVRGQGFIPLPCAHRQFHAPRPRWLERHHGCAHRRPGSINREVRRDVEPPTQQAEGGGGECRPVHGVA